MAYIKRLELVPNIDDKTISIVVHGNPAAKDAPILAEVTANGNNVASGKGKVGQKLSIDIPDQKLWSPDSPFLYDLEISLEGDSPHTQVGSHSCWKEPIKKILYSAQHYKSGTIQYREAKFGLVEVYLLYKICTIQDNDLSCPSSGALNIKVGFGLNFGFPKISNFENVSPFVAFARFWDQAK